MANEENKTWIMGTEIKEINDKEKKTGLKSSVRLKGADAKRNLEVSVVIAGDCDNVKQLLSDLHAIKAGSSISIEFGSLQNLIQSKKKK